MPTSARLQKQLTIYRDCVIDDARITKGLYTTQYAIIVDSEDQNVYMPYLGKLYAKLTSTLSGESLINVESALVTFNSSKKVSYYDSGNIIQYPEISQTENGYFTFILPSGVEEGTIINIQTAK